MQELLTSYEVKEQLGKGAYGTVFRCVCRASGDVFAAKVMAKKQLGEKGCKQVEEEVSVQLELKHPRVTAIKETFEDDDSLIVVMELVTGGELFKRLTQLKHYSEKSVCEIMHNLLSALDYIHQQGVVHRDLKPDNMLLIDDQVGTVETGSIKVADFGFATRFRGQDLTQACGTPYYIAPELLNTAVFKSQTHYNAPACDMWSAGVICYLLLCGYPPFRVNASDGNAKAKLFKQIVRGRVVFDKGQAWDHISDEAKELVAGMLKIDPERRTTAKQALNHPWFQRHGVNDTHLESSLEELELFNAKQKVKGAFYGVEATFLLLFKDACRKFGVRENSGLIEQMVSAKEALKELDISNNYIGPKGLDALTSILDRHPTLRALRLRNTLLSTDQVVNLCKVLQRPASKSKIRVLDLSENPLTHPAGRALLSMLQSRGMITEIDLSGTHISPALINKIQTAAKHNLSRQA
eukprot:TRINITY_DN11158_c0_g1_i1.p2 TRINITY_DN11158_c0_g1~~TRINITY_DN11158_c0_g1_i1.p2  ORF type:complete len:466 (+),score=179.51 TRINITY_DN11158_c0_g1_i1:58-1455(+)